MNTYAFIIEVQTDFDQTVTAALSAIEAHHFKTLHIHDVQATLASKGIEHPPYKLIEFCRAPASKKALDIDPLVGLFLPCKIVVFEHDGGIHVAALRPQIIGHFFEDADLQALVTQIDADVKKLMETFSSTL